MRFGLIFLSLLFLPGCLTLGGGREIRTEPTGALVTVEGGYGKCETPCTIKLDVPRFIRIAKAGYVEMKYKIEPGDGPITIPLELAAASEEIDTQALPDIE